MDCKVTYARLEVRWRRTRTELAFKKCDANQTSVDLSVGAKRNPVPRGSICLLYGLDI